MALVDDQGRLFGRWNVVDALIGVVLLGLIPILYGAYLLFREAPPSLTSIEPARVFADSSQDITVRGTNLRPYMRVSFGPHQGEHFLFSGETEAVVPIDKIPAGTYDVILYDNAQERARIPNGLEVVAHPQAQTSFDLIGSFTGVSEAVAQSLKEGLSVSGLGEIVRLGTRVPAMTRTTLGAALILDVPSSGLFNVPAVIRSRCALVQRSGSVLCMAGDTALMEDVVLRAPLPDASVMFQIDQLRLPGPTESMVVRVRFAGDRPALELMRQGDRDVRRQNEFGAGGVIASIGAVRQTATAVGVVFPGPGPLPPFVATELAFRDAVLHLPAQRVGEQWHYAGRTIRIGNAMPFFGPNYEMRATVLSIEQQTGGTR